MRVLCVELSIVIVVAYVSVRIRVYLMLNMLFAQPWVILGCDVDLVRFSF